MRPAYYQDKWMHLKESSDAFAIESLVQRVAFSFIERYFYSDEYNADYIELLCDMATHFEDEELNQLAARALFGIVIERLCDDFEELQTETYNRLICQIISFLRQLPDGKALHRELNSFGLESEQQLYQRIESIRLSPDEPVQKPIKPAKVLILSRVTIGADVAITSVICQRVAHLFPNAEIVVFGNAKLSQVFSVESGVKVHEIHYSRRGGLLERFLVWLDLLNEIRLEITGMTNTDYLVLDPDSRLTQLGVLPLVTEANYRFFNSRGKPGYPAKASISELTNLWLDNLFGHSEFCYPKVWPDQACLTLARSLRKQIAADSIQTLITLNFGVGGNLRKSVSGSFESDLVMSLLKEPNTKIILDLGFGEEERQRSETILARACEQNIQSIELAFRDLDQVSAGCRLIGVECSVSEIAALISVSDEFIGYDSACQHIAAAQNIKTYTVFAGTNNVRFIRRWHACGSNVSEILFVDTISRDKEIDNIELVERLADLRSD